jgi:hypothetical protein
MSFSQNCKLLGYLKKKKTKKKTTTIKYKSSSSYPQLFPVRPGMAQVFIRQGCRHFGFTDDFVTKRNNK